MFLCFFIAELTSTKAAGAFDIALSLLEHCEVPPMPDIFSFKHQKSKGDHLAQYQVMSQDEFKKRPFHVVWCFDTTLIIIYGCCERLTFHALKTAVNISNDSHNCLYGKKVYLT